MNRRRAPRTFAQKILAELMPTTAGNPFAKVFRFGRTMREQIHRELAAEGELSIAELQKRHGDGARGAVYGLRAEGKVSVSKGKARCVKTP